MHFGGQPVPQPRHWDVDDLTGPVDIVDPEALTRAWQRTKRARSSNQMTDEELTISGVCMVSPGRLVELAKVLSSRPLALIVIGSCAEVKDHVPDMKQLEEISLVVFDPLTKKYEERGVRQRVTCIQVGSQPVNRSTESVDAQMPDGHTIEFTIDVLEDSAPMEVWEAFEQNPYKGSHDILAQT